MSKATGPRKRDLMRNLLRKSGKPLSSDATGSTLHSNPSAQASLTSITTSLQMPLSIQQSQKFLEDALSALNPEEQDVIREHQAHGTEGIAAAVADALKATRNQQKICEDKRWHWKNVILRNEADKVLRWLDHFKSVGDVVANVDPLHVGLPWAGIRIILTVTIADSQQMAALMTGLNLTLHVSNRLSLYFDYFMQLPTRTIATITFAEALVKMYSLVLRFLARAISMYRKGYAARVWRTLWELAEVDNFESRCTGWALQADIDANNCYRETYEQDRNNAKKWKDDLDDKLRSLDHIQNMSKTVARLNVKFDLKKLNPVRGATHDTYSPVEGESSRCLEGTRMELLQKVVDWADDRDAKRIFWLCGKAGTGKSTMSRTIAYTLEQQRRLGASFFFKKGEGDRGNGSRFFPTIIAQLGDTIPGLGPLLADALDADSFLNQKNIQDQFEKLVSQPLSALMQSQPIPPYLFLVIDAMDECEPSQDIRIILSLLAQLNAIPAIRLRIFVTSRPELPVELGFRRMSNALHEDIILEEVQTSTIHRDIRAYFAHRFEEIRIEDEERQSYDPLPLDWPGDEDMQALVDMAVPLFIFAFTVCRYIAEANPRGRLSAILQQQQNMALSGLERTYLPIIKQTVQGKDIRQQDETATAFRRLVGPMVLLEDPLPVSSLSRLLEVPLRDIGETLRPFHSVLNIPKDLEAPVRLYHLSFRDYLVYSETKDRNPFLIDHVQTHGTLARQCLRLLSQPEVLKKDLCGLGRPGLRRISVSGEHIAHSVPLEAAYACRYWVRHLVESGKTIHDKGEVHKFLRMHFLHWMEALSWLGGLSSLVAHISTLQSIIQIDIGSRLSSFLTDAKRFVLQCRHVSELAPLQLYASALVFTPTQSVVRQTFEKMYGVQSLSLLPKVPRSWSADIQRLGHHRGVNAVAISPNGQTLASGSNDETVRLWNIWTGEQMQKLEGHGSRVNAVAFSPNGQTLASASFDKTVRLWNVFTGAQMQKLEGHDYDVKAVAFSPDGHTVASTSTDIRLWDASTGEQTQKLDGHDGRVNAITFIPNGQMLASASDDKTVRLWNRSTGEQLLKLQGHSGWVNSVAFSPDGQILASASDDTTIRLWNASTGEQIHKLEGHGSWVKAVTFSPDGQTFASASSDGTVRLWNSSTAKQMQKLDGHYYDVRAVAFSPDGQTLASTSADRTVILWNASTSEQIPKLEGHSTWVKAVAFSPDGRTLASASSDGTVWLWNALTGEQLQRLDGHERGVNAVVFSPNGQTLASASNDRTIRLWNVTTGEQMHNLEGHNNIVSAIAFSPNGQTLASASIDKTVRLWNTSTFEQIQKLEGHENWVNVVAFSPDGHTLASADGRMLAPASDNNTVRLWSVSTGEYSHHFQSGDVIHRMSFAGDGKSLNTDVGDFDIAEYVSSSSGEASKHKINIVLQGEWIQCDNQDVLWLPHEYRGSCSAVHGNTLVIGQHSGAVSFFRLNAH